MNELLEQFLSEARDALEGIGSMLMALENAPDDADLMAQLFRLVHTLKGNSGLFDFPEMTRVLHAGEDLMDAVRNGRVAYSQTLADRLLDAMDFVGMLCDDIEHEKPPEPRLSEDAVALAAGLRALLGGGDKAPSTQHSSSEEERNTPDADSPIPDAGGDAGNLSADISAIALARVPEDVRLQAWQQAQAGETLLWLGYQPASDCFFQGEDPLHQAKMTPGLLWGGMAARADWPPLAELDAYNCMLDFDMLLAAPRAEVLQHFRYVPEQITLLEVPPLSLVLPQGDPNGGPIYEDFVSDALGFLARSDLDGLGRSVRSLLDLSSPSLWLSSVLRWMAALLASPTVSAPALRALIESLRTFEAPKWPVAPVDHAPEAPITASTETPVVAPEVKVRVAPSDNLGSSRLQAIANVLAVQREILALPDDAAWVVGRLKAVLVALTGCLKATGRLAEQPALAMAAEEAMQRKQARPLADWLEAAFDHAQAPVVELATPVAAPLKASEAGDISVRKPVELVQPDQGERVAANSAAQMPVVADVPETESRYGRRAEDSNTTKSLKVDQVKVDRLMNLIGEMVVAKNAIPYLANRAENVFGMRELSREIKAQYAVINRISEEMQDAIMQVRMMPVSFVFQRFPRLVRDISRRLGKEVHLVLEGEDTAADKNIIESLGDPLVHIVRNSLDHGLEMPDVRLAAGKPASGTLKIVAKQESDRVLISISDDGKGIDPEVIKHKAYQKGVIDENQLDRITDQEAINLIFAAGFSTAEVVSDLSGRGVGMDVVRTAVERVNGTVHLESIKGQGTTLTLSLPLSMAVTNVMTVASDGQMFGVPMDMVVETVRVPQTSVRKIKQRQATVLRGQVVPLLSLNSLLGLAAPPLCNDSDELATLVVRLGDTTVGLLVDQFHGTADIILKPLGGVLGNLKCYAGSALMGDGSVLMVLNLKEML